MALIPVPSELHRRTHARPFRVTASSPDLLRHDIQVDPTPPQQVLRASSSAPNRGGYRPMTVGDEVSFAWALAGAAGHALSRRERTRMCVTLGAGDSTRAVIEYLLAAIATRGVALSDDLVNSALDWLAGFAGTEEEPRLTELIEGVCPASHHRAPLHAID